MRLGEGRWGKVRAGGAWLRQVGRGEGRWGYPFLPDYFRLNQSAGPPPHAGMKTINPPVLTSHGSRLPPMQAA